MVDTSPFCCVDVSARACVCVWVYKKSKLDETREIKNEGKIVANIQNNISQIDECEKRNAVAPGWRALV